MPYRGKPVCAVLQDGTHVYGYVAGLEGDQLLLCEELPASGFLSSKAESKVNKGAKKVKAKNVKGPKSTKKNASASADVSGFGFYPYGFAPGVFALSLGLIALLFALPFGFFI